MHPSPALKPTSLVPSNDASISSAPAPARPGIAAAVLLGLLRAYKVLLSPLFTGCCRFSPSWSDYMREAVITHGVIRGSWLGLRRLARCHPFGGQGYDPCPAAPVSAPDASGISRMHGT